MQRLGSNKFTFSKRLLGGLLLLGGIAGNLGLVTLDLIRRSDQVGPQQRAAMIVLGVLALIGLTLIPLGKAKA